MLNIYSLTRNDTIGYDEVAAYVIAAGDEDAARQLAAELASDEGPATWESTRVTVRLIGKTTSDFWTEEVIMRDFNAG